MELGSLRPSMPSIGLQGEKQKVTLPRSSTKQRALSQWLVKPRWCRRAWATVPFSLGFRPALLLGLPLPLATLIDQALFHWTGDHGRRTRG